MIVQISIVPAIEEQSNPTIPSTDIPATANDFESPTLLTSTNAEPNTEAPTEDPSNLEMANETTTPQTEEELPFIDADSQSDDTGRPDNSLVARYNHFGKHNFQY